MKFTDMLKTLKDCINKAREYGLYSTGDFLEEAYNSLIVLRYSNKKQEARIRELEEELGITSEEEIE